MLKRTKGRILLTMLVITGLAGTVNNSTLSNQERKFIVSQLKEKRADLLGIVKNLSEKQLDFRPSQGKWSIRDYISHISLSEKILLHQLGLAMQQPANPEKRLELALSDLDVLKIIDIKTINSGEGACHPPKQVLWSTNQLLSEFKSTRAAHLKYVKTTTEDLRNHFIQLPIGLVDCYQAILFLAGHSNGHTVQINEILTDPGFPRK